MKSAHVHLLRTAILAGLAAIVGAPQVTLTKIDLIRY